MENNLNLPNRKKNYSFYIDEKLIVTKRKYISVQGFSRAEATKTATEFFDTGKKPKNSFISTIDETVLESPRPFNFEEKGIQKTKELFFNDTGISVKNNEAKITENESLSNSGYPCEPQEYSERNNRLEGPDEMQKF